ncbi:MAG: HprK-related kinase A [Vicinamibacterales bacterium]
MTLGELAPGEIAQRLARARLCITAGPFVLSIRSPIPVVAQAIATLYRDFPIIEDPPFSDFHVDVLPRPGLRRWVRPQAVFGVRGYFATDPFNRPLAAAFFEWGLNACIARRAQQYLIVHAAVVERHGKVTALVGASGSGKSTLCAALTIAGWRLLSDELALIVPGSTTVIPLTRPISLKNDSIAIVQQLDPSATFGPLTRTLRKGVIRHVRPPSTSVERMLEPADLARIVFVQYRPGADTTWTPVAPADAFTNIAAQSMNYGVRGAAAFTHLAGVVEGCTCSSLAYGNLTDAVATLSDERPGRA